LEAREMKPGRQKEKQSLGSCTTVKMGTQKRRNVAEKDMSDNPLRGGDLKKKVRKDGRETRG